MIEVRTFRGCAAIDTAEADTPEAAVAAARALWDDAHGGPWSGRRSLEVMFLVDGRHVRTVTSRP